MKKFLPIIFSLFISLLSTSYLQVSNGKFNNDSRELMGYYEMDLNTNGGSKVPSQTTNATTYSSTLSTIKNTNLRLKFSADNVQNIIYFENIIIFYECLK